MIFNMLEKNVFIDFLKAKPASLSILRFAFKRTYPVQFPQLWKKVFPLRFKIESLG